MARQLLTALVAAALGASVAAAPSTAADDTGTDPTAGTARTAFVFGPAQRAEEMARARARAEQTRRALGLSARETLRVKDVVRDRDGTLHVRYTRTYAGLDVVAGDLVVHTAPAGGRSVDWASTADLSALGTPRPQMSAPAAADTAATASSLTPVAAAPRLAVYALGDRARLAWQVTVAGRDAGAPAREVSYVSADTGAALSGWSLLQHARGQGRSLYSGRVPLVTARAGAGRFTLRDIRRGGHQVRDLHNVANEASTGDPINDADNVWGNGRPSNRQSAAVDAAHGAALTWDYFRSQHRRTGIRNNGRAALSRVHFGRNLDTAFWMDSCFCMTYGDGGAMFNPLVAVDVVAHEMAHGVTFSTADLVYMGESGGLNEATSDIFAALVEFSARNPRDRGDYLVGEAVTRRGGFLRRMDRPEADNVSFGCWTPTVGNADVHHSSGIGNHFFYLLAEGSGAKVISGVRHNSPTCDASTLTGIGRDAAARIWYRALTVYMTSSTNYTDGRDATIRAARDLFGAGSARCAAVVRAWDAVAVPAGAWACTGTPVAFGPNAVTNPGFESDATGWDGVAPLLKALFPHSGTTSAIFNDQGRANTDTITQRVVVPAGAPVLRFELAVFTLDTAPGNQDTFAVAVIDSAGVASTVTSRTNADSAATYRTQTHDLSAYAGQSVTLRFTGIEDATDATAFLVDDVSVTPN